MILILFLMLSLTCTASGSQLEVAKPTAPENDELVLRLRVDTLENHTRLKKLESSLESTNRLYAETEKAEVEKAKREEQEMKLREQDEAEVKRLLEETNQDNVETERGDTNTAVTAHPTAFSGMIRKTRDYLSKGDKVLIGCVLVMAASAYAYNNPAKVAEFLATAGASLAAVQKVLQNIRGR